MARLLILFAHPALEKSRIHRRLIRMIPRHEEITLHDLYEAYPTFNIHVPHEQKLLLEHDLIILQHPLYWYSVPALLKQWIDLVLEHGWAYGSRGTNLRGKRIMSLTTAGGGASGYTREGHNRHTIRELFAPIEQTFRLCGMQCLPPYVIYGAHRMNEPEIARTSERYQRLLLWLQEERVDLASLTGHETLNEVFEHEAKSEVTR